MSEKFEEMCEPAAAPAGGSSLALSYDDFVAYAPTRACVYLPCKTLWPNASVDNRLPRRPMLDRNGNPVVNANGKIMTIPASKWLEQNQSVETLTWAPGEPEFICGRLAVEGGWVIKPGATTLNTYRPPMLELGDASKATRWVEHWHAIYANDAEHCIDWLASRTQRPEVKINHALVLGGAPKIGKDTLLQPVVTAVGSWNFREVTLNGLLSKNNEFLRATVLRVSEARDMGEQGRIDRYGLYDHTKNMLATPPDMLRINEKYIREYYICNCFGMVITTNHRDALYLPADDRRHYVTYSDRQSDDFDKLFWDSFWDWYTNGDGIKHVVALLHQRDLSNFNPKAPPPKTPAFWYAVSVEHGSAHGELADAIDALHEPDALTIAELQAVAPALEWLRDGKKLRAVSYRLAECHYIAVPNPTAKSGLWVVNKRRQMIYARASLTGKEREDAARALQLKLTTEAKER